MQMRALLVFALVSGPSSCAAISSLSTARLWLRSHSGAPPGVDELDELKTANPMAYGIVQALLAKRSLGLLDPKHPSASFAKAPPQEVQQGPEVYDQFASPGEVHHQALVQPQVAVPYSDVQPAAHRDMFSWRPQSGGMSDDQMVANVLGAVAQLKGSKAGLLSKRHNVAENALVADEESFLAPQPVKLAAAPKTSGYLDFDLMTEDTAARPAATESAVAAPAAPKENPYLKGLDLNDDDQPEVAALTHRHKSLKGSSSSGSNLLDSFSWDDSKPAVEAPLKPKVVVSKVKNSLMGWLGVVDKEPAVKVEAPAKPTNPYLMDLSD